MQLEALSREVEALRLVAPLLAEDGDEMKKPAASEKIPWKDATSGLPVKSWP